MSEINGVDIAIAQEKRPTVSGHVEPVVSWIRKKYERTPNT